MLARDEADAATEAAEASSHRAYTAERQAMHAQAQAVAAAGSNNYSNNNEQNQATQGAAAEAKDALLLQAEGLVERQQAYIANLEARLEHAEGALILNCSLYSISLWCENRLRAHSNKTPFAYIILHTYRRRCRSNQRHCNRNRAT